MKEAFTYIPKDRKLYMIYILHVYISSRVLMSDVQSMI